LLLGVHPATVEAGLISAGVQWCQVNRRSMQNLGPTDTGPVDNDFSHRRNRAATMLPAGGRQFPTWNVQSR
jgi:hypothetical protein